MRYEVDPDSADYWMPKCKLALICRFESYHSRNFTPPEGEREIRMSEEMLSAREKYWEELDDSQKIEKLGERIEYLKSILDRQGEIIQKLENHVHVNDRMFFCEGAVNALCWPNNNILNRLNGYERVRR